MSAKKIRSFRLGGALVAVAVGFLLGSFISPDARAYAPPKDMYQSQPFMSAARTSPQVLLVISKDHKMFYQAYNNLADLDGDGLVDMGFDPSIAYTGYFDVRSCYKYVNNQFERAGLANTTHAEALNPTRPASLANRPDIKVPRSQYGVCVGTTANGQGEGALWHGNWLNYIVTSRMDAIRKVLFGGKRRTDTTTSTVLQPSFVPRDSHVWGVEVAGDNVWATHTRHAPYYDFSLYAGVEKPVASTYSFIGRYQVGTGSDTNLPRLEIVRNISVNHQIPLFHIPVRIWDWTTGEVTQPDVKNLPAGYQTLSYNALVKVCDPTVPGGISETEGCVLYGADTGANIWKPAGLLQEYGADDKMYFGLLSGTTSSDTTLRLKGGVMRRHIESMTNSVDYLTGIFKSGAIIDYLSKFYITGWSGAAYGTTTTWGTPMGEMVFEATRYLAGASDPYYVGATWPGDDYGATVLNWNTTRPIGIVGSECAHPVILLMSDIYPDYDGDNWPSSDATLNGVKPLSTIKSPPAVLTNNFNKDAYLNAITSLEGFNSTGRTFFYSNGSSNDCVPKTLNSLTQVKGLCPSEPAREGTYSIAAAAWFAHTHNLSGSTEIEAPVDFYTVAMTHSYPEVTFDLGSHGKVTVLPASESGTDTRIYGFLNYFIMDWETDSNGVPFYIKIVTNFEGGFEGSDYDRDALGTYEFSLLGTKTGAQASPAIDLARSPLRIHSGELRDPAITGTLTPFTTSASPTKYYRFQNYRVAADSDAMDYTKSKITIDLDKVVGFSVTSDAFGSTTGGNQSVGYTISGTTHDGTYMDATHSSSNYNRNSTVGSPWPNASGIPAGFVQPNGMNTARNSPWSCMAPGGANCGIGQNAKMTYYQTRGFVIATGAAKAEALPNPIWMAAKYGGFNDKNFNGIPDAGEWERNPANPSLGPANYFLVSNINQLKVQLDNAFRSISRSISTGTSTSASMDALLGGGISIQTLYYPTYRNPTDETDQVRWVGSVFALFIDKWGNLREDDGDHALSFVDDNIVTFTSLASPPAVKPVCWTPANYITRCEDEFGTNVAVTPLISGANPSSVHQIDPVWDVGQWLALLDVPASTTLISGPRTYKASATLSGHKRLIYFEDSLTDPGVTQLSIFNDSASLPTLSKLLLHDNFTDVLPAVSNKATATTDLINWIVGKDRADWRSRTVGNPWGDNSTKVTWRLGDILNSKPIILGPATSNFDLLYGDMGYLAFKQAMSKRRQMVYFGSNDGLLHAVNMGFGGTLAEGRVKYALQSVSSPLAPAHELGSELWAFIPKGILPQLQFLPDPEYVHTYYVDLKPLIVDLELDGEWRSALIGGPRMGGRPIEPSEGATGSLALDAFYSEIFALDVIDPEEEPVFLWSYSTAELGLTVGQPTVVKSGGKWYVVIPTGPRTDSITLNSANKVVISYGTNSPYDGYSVQYGRLIVLDAETGVPVVDPAVDPDYLRAEEPNSFFNNPFLPVGKVANGDWHNHVVYYGLTESSTPALAHDGGAVYRLQMVDLAGNPLAPENWRLKRFFSPDRPVTGAINATYDSRGNLWIVFGTGKLWGMNDISPCLLVDTVACQVGHDQFLYGIKESLDSSGNLTFADLTAQASSIIDVSGGLVIAPVASPPYVQGLPSEASPALYEALVARLNADSAIGYKRKLDMRYQLEMTSAHNYEMVLSQPKLVAMGGGVSLMSVTSFIPDDNICGGFGTGYMYVVDTFTGLPRPELYETFNLERNGSGVIPVGAPERMVTGGMVVGVGKPTEASIIQAAGKTIFRASASDGGIADAELVTTTSSSNGMTSWREVLDSGFALDEDMMVHGLN
ncbi:MAG: hypothetical protein LBO66_01875 [Deltaproteobacteria bacterium]|jgi:type IV pilus assembly protein PilY1|nr:hypothetical protein [Deltaproteobacteria bacterium]